MHMPAQHAGVWMWCDGGGEDSDRTSGDCFRRRGKTKSAIAQREAAGRRKEVGRDKRNPAARVKVGEGWVWHGERGLGRGGAWRVGACGRCSLPCIGKSSPLSPVFARPRNVRTEETNRQRPHCPRT